MTATLQVIKAKDIPRQPFDAQLCLTEAQNCERLMEFHAARCDDADLSDDLSNMFSALSKMFSQKSLALRQKDNVE